MEGEGKSEDVLESSEEGAKRSTGRDERKRIWMATSWWKGMQPGIDVLGNLMSF